MLFLEGLKSQNVLIMFLFSMKHLFTEKTALHVNDSLRFFTLYQRATAGNFVYVESNFWCLVIVSTKLMQCV